jgi:hypothetical protein
VDAEGRGGGAAGEVGGSAGVALGCVTGAGEAGVGVEVTGDGVALDGGKVALMVPGEGEGEDAIGALQCRHCWAADSLVEMEARIMGHAAIQGTTEPPTRENLADSRRN